METSFKPNPVLEAAHYFTNKVQFSTGPVEVDHAWKDGKEKFNIIDVRARKDFDEGHVPGAVSLPEDRWSSLEGLAKDRLNLIYCYSSVCHLAARAAVDFAKAGYPVMEMDGGFEAWKEHDLEIEKAEKGEGALTDDQSPAAASTSNPSPDAQADADITGYAERPRSASGRGTDEVEVDSFGSEEDATAEITREQAGLNAERGTPPSPGMRRKTTAERGEPTDKSQAL